MITAVTTGIRQHLRRRRCRRPGPIARIVNEVLAAANSSFSDALSVVLILAGVMLLLSAGVAAGLVRGRRATIDDL